jgi:hypothetical protein
MSPALVLPVTQPLLQLAIRNLQLNPQVCVADKRKKKKKGLESL